LNDDWPWTIDLGQAVLNQQPELMNAIQKLRGQANASGVLQNSSPQVIVVTNTIIEKTVEQQIVYVTNTVVQIQPANPQVVYVPTYPPTIDAAPPPGSKASAQTSQSRGWSGGSAPSASRSPSSSSASRQSAFSGSSSGSSTRDSSSRGSVSRGSSSSRSSGGGGGGRKP
jgi:hypothetical protein